MHLLTWLAPCEAACNRRRWPAVVDRPLLPEGRPAAPVSAWAHLQRQSR